jgi:hypothetical protein
VTPGTYTVRLASGGRTLEQKVEVKDDPRIDATGRSQGVERLPGAGGGAIRQFAPVADKVQKAPAGDDARTDLKRQARELLSRLTRLYGETGRWVGRPTADQQSEFKFYQEMAAKLVAAAVGI